MNETFPDIEALQETSQNAKKCCEKVSSRGLEINLIVFNSIAFVIFLILAILLKKGDIVYIAFIFILIIILLIIIAVNLLFSSLIRHWRRKNLIKIKKKKCGIILSVIGFIASIFFLIGCIAEKFINDYHKKCTIYYCKKIYYKKKDIRFLHTIFSLIEIWSIFQIWIWHILRKRIFLELDEPPSFSHLGIQIISNESIIKEDNIPISTGETVDDSQVNIEIANNKGKNIDDKNKDKK